MPSGGKEPSSLWKRPSEEYAGEYKFHKYTRTKEKDEVYIIDSNDHDLTFFQRYPKLQYTAKYLHVFSFGSYILLLGLAEFTARNGVGKLIPEVWFRTPAIVGLVLIFQVIILFGFVVLLKRSGKSFLYLVNEIVRPVFFYVGLGVLLVGTIASVAVITLQDPKNINTNIIHISGFFCLLYIGGPLTYDGMLRTQHMFNNLTSMDIIASEPNNRADNQDSKKDTDQQKVISDDWLNNRGLGVLGKTRLMIVMSFLFVAPFLVIWLIRNGPFNTGSYLTILITLIVNILLVTLAIHFVVLVHVMHSVLTTNKKDPIWIEYKPFHPDMAAGFRDFGRFATRVNGLLILGAMYLGYRSFVQGRLAFVSRDTTFSVAAIDSLWIINYLLPVIAYLIVVFLWSYYSFYIIHRAMKRGKQRRLNRILTSEFDETDHYSEWESVKSGPVWPINDRLVVALLSADLVSFAIALVALFS